MIIALTGTPGTGKTAVCSILKERYGDQYSIVDLNKLVMNERLYTGKDEIRDSYDVDLSRLEKRVKQITDESHSADIVLEGHLSHFLPADVIIVLRAHPVVLKRRLGKRKGFSFRKIKENADAEALDVILVESAEMSDKVFEIDTTDMVPETAAESVVCIIESLKKGRVPEEFLPGKIDWIDQVEIE